MAAVTAVAASAPATIAPPVAKDVASARKRRRRAPAGGAADDCFTCAKRNVKCDRRRPYCSQCLEIGNECSGYKTQLTWGVGVASRGKLRGLSLPIAKAPPVNPGKTVKSPTKSRAGSIVVHNQWPEQQQAQQQTQEQQTAQQQQQPSPPHQQQQSPPHHHHQHPHVHQPPKRDHRDVRENAGRRSSLQVPSVPPTPFLPPGYELPRMSSVAPTESLPAMMSQPAGWTHIPFPTGMPSNEGHRFPNRNLHLTLPGTGEMLGSSMDSMSEVDYMSPLTHSFPRDDMPFIHSPAVLYDGNAFPTHSSPIPRSPLSSIMMEPQRVPTTGPSLVYSPSEPAPSLPNLASMSSHSHVDNFDAQLSHKMDCDPIVPGTSDMDAYSTSAQSHGGFWATSSTDDDSVSQSVTEHNPQSWPVSLSLHSPTPTPSSLVPLNPELIAKMPFFMDYYENTMCPSMVFIDSPGNPFRDHILQLGTGSRSLQHAICALAACNLRMKRKLSLGQHSINIDDKRLASAPTDLDTQPEDQSLSEEYQHRNLAVHLLNEQLNDPDKSRHDSVLATILLLCHYRMAESGIAKFHTQFAGVRKILSMRRASPNAPSRDSAWMEALFTYFDAISASINDREAQLNTSFYGVLPDAQLLPLGAENLVGCDRELFKTIIKLGRLNLLSQHRPVQNLLPNSPRPHAPSSRSASPLDSHTNHTFKPSRPLNADHLFSSPPPPTTLHQSQLMNGGPVAQPPASQQQNQLPRFDGNGFVKTLDDDDLLGAAALHAPTSPPMPMTPAATAAAYDDRHNNFWREWKDARIALQSWEFDAGRVLAGMPLLPPPPGPASAAQIPHPSGAAAGGGPTAAQVRDLGHLSEAFRYAALLYTERLASPNVPSAHANFRNLVNQVVYYATSLEAGSTAEKFLLWPLFVAGSECVNELQQNIVRSKCRDIMARSGYMNNLAALDVLERLWAGDWKEMDLDMGNGANGGKMGPFNWTKCIGGPGVEVEWIMF